MSIKVFKKISAIALSAFVLGSCSEPGFYESSLEGRDIYRIPMIEPYIMRSYDNINIWYYESPVKKYQENIGQVQDVNLIGIKGSVFVFYTKGIYLPNVTKGIVPVWFIVDTKTKREMPYTSEASYKAGLDSLGIDNVKLYDIKKVFTDFDDTGKLPPEWPTEALH